MMPFEDATRDVAARYRSRPAHYYVRSKLRMDPVARALVEQGGTEAFGDVVDVACGRGQLALLLRVTGVASAVTGLDWDLGKVANATDAAAGLENAAILMLFAVAVWAGLRGRIGKLPFGLSVGLSIFCLILAFLIGLTTPNLGSLSRYRSDLLPFLLLLLLQNEYAAKLLSRLRLDSKVATKLISPETPSRPAA